MLFKIDDGKCNADYDNPYLDVMGGEGKTKVRTLLAA